MSVSNFFRNIKCVFSISGTRTILSFSQHHKESEGAGCCVANEMELAFDQQIIYIFLDHFFNKCDDTSQFEGVFDEVFAHVVEHEILHAEINKALWSNNECEYINNKLGNSEQVIEKIQGLLEGMARTEEGILYNINSGVV